MTSFTVHKLYRNCHYFTKWTPKFSLRDEYNISHVKCEFVKLTVWLLLTYIYAQSNRPSIQNVNIASFAHTCFSNSEQ